MYMLLKVQIFLLSCIPANFWQHTIVITRGNKAGFILPPKQQWKCQNNFKWPAENSFLLHPLNLPSKRPHEGQRIPYCQPWHSGSKKTRISTQLKQPILHKVVTKRILSFSLRQGKILHDQSWSEFLLPIQTLKTQSEPPSISKTDGRQFCTSAENNFAVQLKTLRHQCCNSKLKPYCFPLIKPWNVPAYITTECKLGYILKTLKHGKW